MSIKHIPPTITPRLAVFLFLAACITLGTGLISGQTQGEYNPSSPSSALQDADQQLQRVKNKVNAAEKRSLKMAAEYRDSVDPAHRADLRQRLRGEVESAFGLRQQLQQLQLRRLETQLTRIKNSIADRDRIRSRIVERRYWELLDPAVRWNAEGSKRTKNRSSDVYARSAAKQPSLDLPPSQDASLDLSPSNAPSLVLSPAKAPRVARKSGASNVSANELSARLREATEWRTKVVALQDEISSYEAILEYNPRHDNIGGITQSLQVARRKLRIQTDELSAQLKLLDLELKDALAAADRARNAVEVFKATTKSGTDFYKTSLPLLERSLEASQLRAGRAQIIRDLYGKIGAQTTGPPLKRIRLKHALADEVVRSMGKNFAPTVYSYEAITDPTANALIIVSRDSALLERIVQWVSLVDLKPKDLKKPVLPKPNDGAPPVIRF